MLKEIPNSFHIYFFGVFNSRLIVDLSNLAQRYDIFRILLCKELMERDDCDVIFEQYENNEEKLNNLLLKAEGIINKNKKLNKKIWKHPTLNISRIFFNPNYFSQNVLRGLSLICLKSEEGQRLTEKIIAEFPNLLETPKIEDIKFTFYEYGIGLITGKANIKFRNSLERNEIEPFINYIKKSLKENNKLTEKIKKAEISVNNAFNNIKEDLTLRNPFFDQAKYKILYPRQEFGEILWAHVVSVFDDIEYEPGQLPFGDKTKEFIKTYGSDEKLANMSQKKTGFVHIGWESSLVVNLEENKRTNVFWTLKQLEYNWRTYQILNDLLTEKYEQLINQKKHNSKDYKKSMRWTEKLTIEFDLYDAHLMNFLFILNPFPKNLYKLTYKSWLMDEMNENIKSKMASIKTIYKQWQNKIKNISNKRLNLILFILTSITFVTTIVDIINFFVPDNQFLSIFSKSALTFLLPLFLIISIWIVLRLIIRERK